MLQSHKAPKTAEAGQAPVAPPKMWTAGERYEGNTESKGVIAQLDIIKEDVKEDIGRAKEGEQKAIADFKEYESETTAAVTQLNEDITDFTAQKSGHHDTRATLMGERKTHHTELTTELDSLGEIWKRCEWLILELPGREEGRIKETADLHDAKTALSSGLKA